MNTITSIIAIFMIGDALFTLLNLSRVKSLINSMFPSLDIKKVAIVEGLVGALILVLKVSTRTVT